MKRILLLAAVALCLCLCGKKEESGYKVEVKFKGDLSALLSDVIVLRNEYFADTLHLVGDSLCFEGRVQTPSEVYITGKTKAGYPLAGFFLENCDNKVTISIAPSGMTSAKTIGGKYQFVKDSLYDARREYLYKKDFVEISNARMNCKDEAEKARLTQRLASLRFSADSFFKASEINYVTENPLSLYALGFTLRNVEDFSEADLDAKIAAFKGVPEYADNKNLKKLEETAEILRSVKIGNKVADFVQYDPQGNPVKFSEVYSKNKLTMVDFWASWCGPCRAFNPTLVKIYEKFHDKGFEVLGISYDTNKDAWRKCLEVEKLPWVQVSDKAGEENYTAKTFYINTIPQNLFVDQNGVLVGYKVNRNEIEKFIEEHLGKY